MTIAIITLLGTLVGAAWWLLKRKLNRDDATLQQRQADANSKAVSLGAAGLGDINRIVADAVARVPAAGDNHPGRSGDRLPTEGPVDNGNKQ